MINFESCTERREKHLQTVWILCDIEFIGKRSQGLCLVKIPTVQYGFCGFCFPSHELCKADHFDVFKSLPWDFFWKLTTNFLPQFTLTGLTEKSWFVAIQLMVSLLFKSFPSGFNKTWTKWKLLKARFSNPASLNIDWHSLINWREYKELRVYSRLSLILFCYLETYSTFVSFLQKIS